MLISNFKGNKRVKQFVYKKIPLYLGSVGTVGGSSDCELSNMERPPVLKSDININSFFCVSVTPRSLILSQPEKRAHMHTHPLHWGE